MELPSFLELLSFLSKTYSDKIVSFTPTFAQNMKIYTQHTYPDAVGDRHFGSGTNNYNAQRYYPCIV